MTPTRPAKLPAPAIVKIVGLGGSLEGSTSSIATLGYALEGAQQTGAAIECFDLATLDVPLYSAKVSPTPDIERWVEAARTADGLLWCSPLYHGSVSGAFKNAIDWLELLARHAPPYLEHKVIGLCATAGGVQGLQAINTMAFIARSLRAWALPLTVTIDRAGQAFDEQGQLKDPALIEALHTLGREVAQNAATLSGKALGANPGASLKARSW